MRKLIIGATLSMLGTSAALAQGSTTNGFDWGIGSTSSTSYELSHREQRHGVQTSDGALHVFVNVGTTNNALQLWSSFNQGRDWCLTFNQFPGTTTGISQGNTTVSTDDVLLVNSGSTQYLDVAFDQDAEIGGGGVSTGYDNALMYAVLKYSPGATCTNGTLSGTPWAYNTGTGIPSYPVTVAGGGSSSPTYQQPSLAIDSSGGVWVSDMEITSAGSTGIKLHYSSSTYGASFTTQAQAFEVPGVTNASNPNHAPRLFNIPSSLGSMGLLFQVSNCLYYTPLTLSGGVITKSGTQVELSQDYVGVGSNTCSLPALQSGRQDTAFSVSTDPSGNSYLAFVIEDPSTGFSNGVYTLNFCGTPLSGLTGTAGPTVCGTQSGDATAGSWIGGQYLDLDTPNYPHAIYAKTSLVTATISGVTTHYSVVFVNSDNGEPGGAGNGQDDNLVEYTSLTFQESPATVNYLGTASGTTAMNYLVHPQPSVVGGLVHFSSFTGGTGYTNGSFPNVTATGGSGTGGKLFLDVAGTSVTQVYPGEMSLTSIGSNYVSGDVLSFAGKAGSSGFMATLGSSTLHGSVTTSTQDYSNSRIEAPQYISVTSTTATMPVWDEYIFDTSSGPPAVYDNSIIYWNEIAVPVLN